MTGLFGIGGPRTAAWAAAPVRPLETYARVAVAAALALMGLGVVMVYSASCAKAGLRYGDAELFLRRQFTWVVLGIVTLWWTMRTDPQTLRRWAKPAGIVVLALLLLVLVPGIGTKVNGAKRWFRLGPVSLQPSELAKLVGVVWLAHHLDLARDKLNDWKQGVLPVAVPLGLAAALTLVEPDLGTAIFLAAVSAAVMLVGGVPPRRLFTCALAALPLLAWQVVSRWEVMMKRIQGMGGGQAGSSASHQVYQAQVAMGSGGLFGAGIGAGRQKLLYLPEAHTDFILPVIGEEMGFLGTLAVLSLFVVIVVCGMRIAMGLASRDRYSFLLVFGAIFMIGLQAAGNVAVVTGSVPTKGIALPFVSLGGSSLLVLCASLGFVYAAARRHDMAAAPVDPMGPAPSGTYAANSGPMTAPGAA